MNKQLWNFSFDYRSLPETDSRSLDPSDNLDSEENELDQTGDSAGDQEPDHPGYRQHRDYHPNNQQVHDQHQRQAEVRAELNNYNRGPDGRQEERRNQSYHRPYSEHREQEYRDYTRPEYSGGRETQENIHPPARRGRGLIYQESAESGDPDHYHEYEDEVCMKCDIVSRSEVSPRSQRRSGDYDTDPRLSRHIPTGCEYDYPSHDQDPPSPAPSKAPHPHPRPPYPPPPHVTHVSYPGYPTVSVQDYTRPAYGHYDDHHTPYYHPQPRPYMQPRFLPHTGDRRRLPPPPRFAGPPHHRFFRPPFPPNFPPRHHVQEYAGVEVHMRNPEYGGPVRRPVSELTPRQFYSQIPQTRPHTDPNSLPRRKLPEIPQQRRHPDTLPRTARPSYSVEDQFDYPEQEHPLHQQSSLEVPSPHPSSQYSSETKSSNNSVNVSRQSERKSPKKAPMRHDDIRTRPVHDKHHEARNITRQSKGSKSPGRQGKEKVN